MPILGITLSYTEQVVKQMSHTKKILLGILGATLVALAIIYLFIALYYKNHFYFGTQINHIDYSGKTVAEAESDIASEIASYELFITGRKGVSDTIYATDINYHYVSDGQIQAFKEKQNPLKWPLSYFNEDTMEFTATCEYDGNLLKEAIRNLIFFQPENILEPEDAFIAINDEGYYIYPETPGTKLNFDQVLSILNAAVLETVTTVDLRDYDCYEKPEIFADNEKLIKGAKTLNKYTRLTINYDFGDRTEILDYSLLKDWVTIDENYEVTINKDKIKNYVNYLGYYYTTFASTREFIRHDGKTIKVKGGDYGWIINRSKEAEALYDIIKKGESVTREPIYSQIARSRNKNDIGLTYVEISLKKQHLWLYVDGEEIMNSDIVTGNISKKRGTPTGIYSITYKERDAVLNGEDYSSPVKYWMPFNHNIGCHDASWRREFGNDIYMRNGSHGCVNMPEENAQILFENIQKGTPVVVY